MVLLSNHNRFCLRNDKNIFKYVPLSVGQSTDLKPITLKLLTFQNHKITLSV